VRTALSEDWRVGRGGSGERLNYVRRVALYFYFGPRRSRPAYLPNSFRIYSANGLNSSRH
jgi:hypothetical protein